jgi:hypothetical protein
MKNYLHLLMFCYNLRFAFALVTFDLFLKVSYINKISERWKQINYQNLVLSLLAQWF